MPDGKPTKPNPADRLPRHVPRTPGDYGRGHLKVDNMLSPEDRDAYFALLRKPGTTLKVCIEWLRSRGYGVGKGAVMRHKQNFDARLESVRVSAEMSLVCSDLLRQVGEHRMSDAAVVRFETLLTQALFDLRDRREMNQKKWETLGRALNNAVGNRVKVETLRLAVEAARRQAGKGARRIDGVALSDKVRRILGVPLPGEPVPALPRPTEGPALPPPRPDLPLPSPGGAQDSSPRREPRDHDREVDPAP